MRTLLRYAAAVAALAFTAGGIGVVQSVARPGRLEPDEGTPLQVRVVSVVDGDTISVETLEGSRLGRVRLLGIVH